MGVKNVLNSCIRFGKNTGFGNCFNDIGFIKGIIFGNNPDQTYTTDTVAALKTALEAAILADLPLNRIYPVGGLVTPTDSSEANVMQTFADGTQAIVREGKYNWAFQWVEGAFCLLYALRAANGLNRPFFLYTADGKLIGTDAGVDAGGLGLMKMIKPNFSWSPPFKLNTGAAVTVYETMMNFDPYLINENIAFVDFKNDGGLGYLKGLKGLQDVVISKVARAANVLTVSAVTSCNTFDLGVNYGATLAAVGAWSAKNVAGAPIALTSVTYSVGVGYVITVNAADANYTAGAPITISLAGPTELAAAPYAVKGFEGIPASIVI